MSGSESADLKRVTMYTDGACRGNPGPGGWGVVLEYGDHERQFCGGEPETTNNRMELTAVIEGLAKLKHRCQVTIYTDSTYVLKGASEWMSGWKKRSWRGAGGKPVKNVELWQQLDAAMQKQDIQWQWVKGHSGHPGNEKADQLANRGIDEMVSA